MFCVFGEFYKSLEVCEGEQSLRETKDNPASRSLGLTTDRPRSPKTPPVERALRIVPVRKEPPAAREQGPRDQCKTQRGEPGIGLQY